MNTIGGISSITNGQSALESAKFNSEKGKFEELLRSVKTESSNFTNRNLSSSQILPEGRLTGDFSTGFAGTFNSESDKTSSKYSGETMQVFTPSISLISLQ